MSLEPMRSDNTPADDHDGDDKAPRAECFRCRRPQSHCLCAHIPTLTTKTRVLFLQHPRERRVAIGTARLAHLALPASEWHEGVCFENNERIHEVALEKGTFVLFPGAGARELSSLAPGEVKNLVFVDGTWSQARKVLRMSPTLASLPRLSFMPQAPGNYRIRKEPSAECVATIEAVVEVLSQVEGDQRFSSMLRPFDAMVEQQLKEAAVEHLPRYRARKHGRGASLVELDILRESKQRAVVVYGEANTHPRETRAAGIPELLHLVASRPFDVDDARFEALLVPERPLADRATENLRLPADAFAAAEARTAGFARFSAYLRDDDVWCVWGSFVRDLLLNEGFPRHRLVDLRSMAARTLGHSPGGPNGGAERLHADSTPWARGRAGIMQGHMQGILRVLVEKHRTNQG